jgi:hypothetical protein
MKYLKLKCNSTNINKQTITYHLMPFTPKKKRPGHMALEILLLAWDRHKNVAGLNQLMGSQPF